MATLITNADTRGIGILSSTRLYASVKAPKNTPKTAGKKGT